MIWKFFANTSKDLEFEFIENGSEFWENRKHISIYQLQMHSWFDPLELEFIFS